jgi:hypothetical protein
VHHLQCGVRLPLRIHWRVRLRPASEPVAPGCKNIMTDRCTCMLLRLLMLLCRRQTGVDCVPPVQVWLHRHMPLQDARLHLRLLQWQVQLRMLQVSSKPATAPARHALPDLARRASSVPRHRFLLVSCTHLGFCNRLEP